MWTTLFAAAAVAGALITPDGAELTLDHTTVDAHVSAGVAVVDVTQHFTNPFEVAIDADYVFPLPELAAVRSMTLSCGDRVIEGRIAPKAEAAERFEQARQEGRKAALLEQQRTHIFTWRISSICPGEDVDVTLQYVDQVAVTDGHFELHFPTTIGKRFAPGDLEEPDLVLPPIEPRQLDFQVHLDEGMSVESLWSDSHDIDITSEGVTGADIGLHDADRIPNKDVHLAWSLATAVPRASMVVDRHNAQEGTFALTLQPQVLEDAAYRRARELIFVMDASGSMSGTPWETAKLAVLRILEDAGPDDTFNLVRFSSGASGLFELPQKATEANQEQAASWLARRGAGGGTRMDAGIQYALNLPTDRPEAMRLVLLMTDGYIGYEAAIFEQVDTQLGDARMFSLGVGSSVNRKLLEGVAWAGRGDALYQLPGTPLDETAGKFHKRIAHPAMTDLTIDFGDLEVTDLHPRRIPDLWAGQPIRVTGRYKGSGPQRIEVHGSVERESWTLTQDVNVDTATEHEAVTQLWARRAIESLDWAFTLPAEEKAERGESIALQHHLVSAWTSLIAEENTPSACGPAATTVDVPLYSPEGVDPSQMQAVPGHTTSSAYGQVSGTIGGLIGVKGQQISSGGLGSRGSGLGGGGSAEGLAMLGTKGVGSGRSGYGTGSGSFGGKGEGAIGTVGGDPIILGSLDRSLIDEVIKRHMNQIRYCYQRELSKDPDLAGKVVVKFAIAADGSISQAQIKSSTMNSVPVESCLTGRFMRMTFPEPAGGGLVIVSYPFVFKPG